jgi:hypothetical protein
MTLADKHVAWEQAHVREGKVPILPDIPVDEQDEDLTVIEGDNMPVEWWEDVRILNLDLPLHL